MWGLAELQQFSMPNMCDSIIEIGHAITVFWDSHHTDAGF